MTVPGVIASAENLARCDGTAFLRGDHALLKGLLESAVPAAALVGPAHGAFGPLLAADVDESRRALLRAHGLSLVRESSAGRAVRLALEIAAEGRAAVAAVPHGARVEVADLLAVAARTELPDDGAVAVLLESRPADVAVESVLRLARRLDLPALVPGGVEQLRTTADAALRLSHGSGRPVAVVVHESLLGAWGTIDARPNRAGGTVEAMLALRRARAPRRSAEAATPLRMLRRLELNRTEGMPSPGERVPLGFVTVGPCDGALEHLLRIFGLAMRLPRLRLVAAHPIDAAVVGRLLVRCEAVVVLEPDPGAVEDAVREVAEHLRRAGERPALVWGEDVPPGEDGAAPDRFAPDETLHPSLVARRLVHLLHRARPAARIVQQLASVLPAPSVAPPPRGAALGQAAARARIAAVVREVDRWLRDRAEEPDAGPPTTIALDRTRPPAAGARVVPVEIVPEAAPERLIAAVRACAEADGPRAVIATALGGRSDVDPLGLVRAAVPEGRSERLRIEVVRDFDELRLLELLKETVAGGPPLVAIVRDRAAAPLDPAVAERLLAEVDRLGFEPRQQARWSLERSCAVREPSAVEPDPVRDAALDPQLRTSFRVDRFTRRHPGAVRLRVRPLVEEVLVRRSRPPRRRGRGASRLPQPEIVHRRHSEWRVHLAGFRGGAPGPVAAALMTAGRRMGYSVLAQACDEPIGPGRRAWMQMLFVRALPPEARSAFAPRVPFGEADLVLGFDPVETLRALDCDPALRVAGAGRSAIVANQGFFAGELGATAFDPSWARELEERGEALALPGRRRLVDAAELSRSWFHTDRLADALLLGMAWQAGFVPASIDAMEEGVAYAEALGYGRFGEAFLAGRELEAGVRLPAAPREDRDEDVHRLVRRVSLLVARAASRRDRALGGILRDALAAMPGLVETDAGRHAVRDFVAGLVRCQVWGGTEYARSFADRIVALYRADRAATGRQLTRCAILPLASAMLPQDPIYLAAMAGSAEHRRRTRQRLDVRTARGDEIERRYLTRFELFALGHRVRLDLRTSDWPSRFALRLRRFVPHGWRGDAAERKRRAGMLALVEKASRAEEAEAEALLARLQRLHEAASRGEAPDPAETA